PFFIEDQTRLVINTLNAFRDTRNFERTTPNINIEEIENDSDDYYSETRHSEENEKNLINNNLFEEQGTPSPQYQTQTPTPEPEEDEMANIDT
ncbi:8547_t:CDS:1, partial [Ambispora gerdemannii]